MEGGYRNNHYVPQWYQRRFIPDGELDRQLFYLDLSPDWFSDGRGKKRRFKALKRTGTRKCFAIDDLYTERIGGGESRELERTFFGTVEVRGKRAVEFFSTYENAADGFYDEALQDLMLYMSTQKLRTPKGLDWLREVTGARDRTDVLAELRALRRLWGAVWAECVWQIGSAVRSETKFLVSDHPVTVYNRACSPASPQLRKGAGDPDVRLHGTHTLFPLSAERLLILTNRTWACNPFQSPLEMRPNPQLLRGAMFNFLEVQTQRELSEQEVLEVNLVLKKRAYRYVAAWDEECLYPERKVRTPWRALGDGYLFMPDPRSLTPGSEYTVGYAGGRTESMDNFGRLPGQRDFGREARGLGDITAHRIWKARFEEMFGAERRGVSWEDRPRGS